MKRVSGEEDSVILAEIRKLRNEHTEAANDTKEALTRLDNVLKDMVERTALLEQRMLKTEERLGDTEDRMARLERSVAFLLHQEAKLAAKCDDLESRLRRNNVRIHGISEGSEKNDTIGFISGFIRSSLQIPAEVDIRIGSSEGDNCSLSRLQGLKVFLASGTKIFTTLTEAAPMLRDMGIHVQEEERDELQRLRTQSSWTMVTRQKEKRSQPHTTGPDPQAVTE
ncbi:hypothetical protein JOQ06_015568 [Pogonophryne albipinna]|uniref:Uncharacterized protein n=1 Tax=Pogonophryne albipinna TaxID=1090488 RepID=A0AAD6AMY2_9TELE|nr:hypothetical protein JOQ06_015568 [Pogonophryne albipinna]